MVQHWMSIGLVTDNDILAIAKLLLPVPRRIDDRALQQTLIYTRCVHYALLAAKFVTLRNAGLHLGASICEMPQTQAISSILSLSDGVSSDQVYALFIYQLLAKVYNTRILSLFFVLLYLLCLFVLILILFVSFLHLNILCVLPKRNYCVLLQLISHLSFKYALVCYQSIKKMEKDK